MSESIPGEAGFRKIVPLARVQLLTDALFALSMVMILLQVDYPEPSVVTEDQIVAFLKTQAPAIEVYAITFILIAIYWVKHMEHFSFIKEIDYRMLWYQLGFLLFLVLLPVANAYATLYPLSQTVFVSYCVVLLGMGTFSATSWRYATKGERLITQGTKPEMIRDFWHDALIEPASAAVAIIATFWSVEVGQLMLLAIPVAFAVRRWRRKRKGQ